MKTQSLQKNYSSLILILFLILVSACSKDEAEMDSTQSIEIEGVYNLRWLAPESLEYGDRVEFELNEVQWLFENKSLTVDIDDEILTDPDKLKAIPLEEGVYTYSIETADNQDFLLISTGVRSNTIDYGQVFISGDSLHINRSEKFHTGASAPFQQWEVFTKGN